jgi:hypothetical protein
MKKKKARGRPKKEGEKKEKVSARLYPSQVKKILDLGFSGVQDFLDEQIQNAEEKK